MQITFGNSKCLKRLPVLCTRERCEQIHYKLVLQLPEPVSPSTQLTPRCGENQASALSEVQTTSMENPNATWLSNMTFFQQLTSAAGPPDRTPVSRTFGQSDAGSGGGGSVDIRGSLGTGGFFEDVEFMPQNRKTSFRFVKSCAAIASTFSTCSAGATATHVLQQVDHRHLLLPLALLQLFLRHQPDEPADGRRGAVPRVQPVVEAPRAGSSWVLGAA